MLLITNVNISVESVDEHWSGADRWWVELKIEENRHQPMQHSYLYSKIIFVTNIKFLKLVILKDQLLFVRIISGIHKINFWGLYCL